ncbi:MAG TPA: homoserine kinase [Burkholderiaceae bacterium]|nr:homoserine kinase [Burkholderiaceae bacterium]
MAVFTAVSRDELVRWLRGFDIGELLQYEGIESGIENSNFFVTTSGGRFVLTLFERLHHDELPFYLNLMRHLARRRIPCPDPVADRGGALLSQLAGKPAALVTRLPGRARLDPDVADCGVVGELLANMHLAAADYPGTQPNLRGLSWWQSTVPRLLPRVTGAQAQLLTDELAHQSAFAATAAARALPESAVHADLFRDNVLFDDRRLGGVIDFYFAGRDTWLFDLAVACNDWCIVEPGGDFDDARLQSLLSAYRRVREPTDAERAAWPTMLRAAAMRFWVSRLFDHHLPRPAQMVSPKDPAHFERILRARRRHAPELA